MSKLKFYLIFILLSVAIIASQFLPSKAQASYNLNLIVTDAYFTNYNSMSAAQINQFLINEGSVYANYVIPQYVDVPYPYVGGNWDTVSVEQVNGAEALYGVTVAQRIYDEAQAHQINPQIILAIMQKESSTIQQSSVSSTCLAWPMFYEFNETMASFGYSQADAQSIAENYGGVGQQIAYATWAFRSGTYLGYNTWASKNWSAAMSVDGTTVYPQSIATRILYTYTPHSWQTFLNVLAGWGWNETYHAARGAQGPSSGPGAYGVSILPGTQFTITASFTNTGTATWTKGAVNLGMSSPQDRASAFTGYTRQRAVLNEDSVAPGGVGTFSLVMTAPNAPGTYYEHFQPVAEGIAWFGDEICWTLQVAPQIYDAQRGAQGPSSGPGSYGFVLTPGQKFTLTASFNNSGNATWTQGLVNLGMSSPRDRASAFTGYTRQRGILNVASVSPGNVGTFSLTMTAPNAPGTYYEHFQPVAEGIAWFGDEVCWTLQVAPQIYDAQRGAQGPAAGQPGSYGVPVEPGQQFTLTASFNNSGNATWTQGLVNLGMSSPQDRASVFTGYTSRRGVLNESSVAPGNVGTFSLTMTAPSTPGIYYEHFRPVAEGIAWFGDEVCWTITVSS